MNYNATIPVRIDRLNYPLTTLFARQFGAFRIKAADVPGDVSAVFLRLVSGDGTSFSDFPGVLIPGGGWRVVIPAFSITQTGDFQYELHGETEDGKVALGRGRCVVQPFTPGEAAPTAGTPVTFAQMPTANGGWVQCVAVMDETGEYTYEFIPISEDGETTE